MDSDVSVLCAVLQGHLQEGGKDGARGLGGLKWKLGKPVCIGEHRGSLSPPATLPWLKAVNQPPQNPYEAAVHRYGVASRLPNNPALSPCCILLLSGPPVSGQPGACCVEFGDSPCTLGDAKSPFISERLQ